MQLSYPRFFSAAILISTAISSPANAQLAGVFEPFSHLANAESWTVYDRGDQGSYIPEWDSAGDGANPDIFLSFIAGGALDFFADSESSGGAFVGDLAKGGVDAIGADIYVEDIDSFDFGEFYFFSATDSRYYVSNLIIPEASGWSFAFASLTMEDWFVYENGHPVAIDLTPEILANITETGFTFYPLDVVESDDKIVALDNFTFYGALILPEIATTTTDNTFQLSFDRRPGIGYSIESTTDLETWSPIPSEQDITGNDTYTMTRSITAGSRFFRIGIDDFLTPVPEIDSP